MSERLRIGTRRSPLALWQARYVRELLMAREPGIEVDLVELVTKGDVILDRPLATVGGKGLFVKEIEDALLKGEVDLAVHSLKDLPAELPSGLVIGAVPEREDAADALCSPKYETLDALPPNAKVGTSSLRRACQLKALRPDLVIVNVRGNVETRLGKIETEGLAAVVLAMAGLRRLGLADRVTERLGPPRFLSAVGQGALAIEVREQDHQVAVRVLELEHRPSRGAVEAERAFLSVLEGNCQVPLAAHATVQGDMLTMHGLVGAPDGSKMLRAEGLGALEGAAAVGRGVAEELLDLGADELLALSAPKPAGG